MRVAELPQQDSHKAVRKKAWRTEVPWLAQLLPSDLPSFVTYVALLRQPRHKCFIGYYKVDSRKVHVPTEFKEQSRQHKFDSAAGGASCSAGSAGMGVGQAFGFCPSRNAWESGEFYFTMRCLRKWKLPSADKLAARVGKDFGTFHLEQWKQQQQWQQLDRQLHWKWSCLIRGM